MSSRSVFVPVSSRREKLCGIEEQPWKAELRRLGVAACAGKGHGGQ